MKQPFLIAAGAGAAVLALAVAMTAWQMWAAPAAPLAEQGLPWQAEQAADGSVKVFGLVPGRSTLGDAMHAVGDSLQIGLVARLGEVGVLEALAEPYRAGYITGRLVLAFQAPPAALARWRAGATGSEAMNGGTRRFALGADDRAAARGAPLVGISFLPAAKLESLVVLQRFGEPEQRLRLGDKAEAWLYPLRGLAVTLDASGRDVLQYVAPADFDARLRGPLVATAASAPG